MKQKFYYLLLTALLGLTGMNAWALDKVGDVYQIATAQDLVDFATKVNTGQEYTAQAVLTADINMDGVSWPNSIGDWQSSHLFKGKFDGQGHSITNLKFTTTRDYHGLFGVVGQNAEIKNFYIDGTITVNHNSIGIVSYTRDDNVLISNIHSNMNFSGASGKRVGGIVGNANQASNVGTATIDRCTYSGTMTLTGTGNKGGIVGYILNNGNVKTTISNCLFNGKITNDGNAETGGIVGYAGANLTKTVIKNCLSIGTINATVCGQFFGVVKNAKCSIINSYYQGSAVNGTALDNTNVDPTVNEATEVTNTRLASGEICFLLNESVSGGTNWFQTLNDDDYPFPYNGGYHDPIYANGSFICDGVTPKEGSTVVYSNANSSIVDPHNFVDGFCSVCGAFDASYMTANADGIFEIGTANQLKWFAVYVNQVEASANAILTADIDLSSIAWTPIGKGVTYGGTFDGQGKTISNFTFIGSGNYNGLFGQAENATIKNFSISGTLNCAGSGNGVIGWSKNTSVSNIHSTLTIEATTGTLHHTAGIVGSANVSTTVDYCSFNGTMTVNASSYDCFGGIVGYTNEYCLIKNCINYGTISFALANCYAGGIIGYINSNACYGTHNCLNLGTVEYAGEGDPTYSGAIVGRLRGNNPALWGYSYYLAGSAVNANGENQIPTNYEVTAAQIASGEVAAKLAPYIRQNVGTDATPVLDPTHNVVAEITAAGYATLYVPDTDVTIPAGVEAFAGWNDGTYLQLTAIDGSIAANEAVVLKGAAGYYSFAPTTGATKAAKNELKGTADDTEAAGKYILAKPADKAVGFYLAESGTIKAGKAYLEIPGGSSVKGFTFAFGDDDPTAIEMVNGQSSMVNEIYNLAGQRMNKMQKGINIVGNKKVLK